MTLQGKKWMLKWMWDYNFKLDFLILIPVNDSKSVEHLRNEDKGKFD